MSAPEVRTEAGSLFLAAQASYEVWHPVDGRRTRYVAAIAAIEAEAIATERARWTDHYPEASSYPDDSSRLDCSCGWEQEGSKLDWVEHVLAIVNGDPS